MPGYLSLSCLQEVQANPIIVYLGPAPNAKCSDRRRETAPSGSHLFISMGLSINKVNIKPLSMAPVRREINVSHGMKVIPQIVMKD